MTEREEMLEQLHDRLYGLSAVLLKFPDSRVDMVERLIGLGASPDIIALVLMRVLEDADALMAVDETSQVQLDLLTRAEVAVSVTPEGLAGLMGPEF